jgi:hypothetical protein
MRTLAAATRRFDARAAWLVALVTMAGCSSDAVPAPGTQPDGGLDAGVPEDAAPPPDAEPPEDAAPPPPDAGDAGTDAGPACESGQVHYSQSLSLTSADEVQSRFPGAIIGGGTFGPDGWTTANRSTDLLILPLPPGIDTRQGSLRWRTRDLDIHENGDCEEFQVISLDYRAEPFSAGSPDRARFDLLHLGNDEDCNTGEVLREGRFELGGTLHGCTAEDNIACGMDLITQPGLAIAGAAYEFVIGWHGTQFELTIRRDGADVYQGGYAAQLGELYEDQFYVIFNQCAGGSWARCGLGPTYPEQAGGMVGATFSDFLVELTCP